MSVSHNDNRALFGKGMIHSFESFNLIAAHSSLLGTFIFTTFTFTFDRKAVLWKESQ
jgi:hypothetical protein